MASEISSSFNLVDSAVGPLGVKKIVYTGFDIDDYVHTTVIGQAIHLQTIEAITKAAPALAADRPPMNIEGATSGGY